MPRKMTKKERKWIADMAKRLPEIPCKETKIVTGLEIMCKEEYAHLKNHPHIDALKKYKLREALALSKNSLTNENSNANTKKAEQKPSETI